MKPEKQRAIISQAHKLWVEGDKAGSIDTLFDAIPIPKRPEWLVRLLTYVAKLIPHSDVVEDIVSFARQDVEDWTKVSPHDMIYKAHHIAYSHKQPMVRHVHMLARYSGKLIANAKGIGAPFDHNSLWKIPDVLVQISIETDSADQFLESVWSLLSDKAFIQLDEPVMCNPRCIICLKRFGEI